MGRKFTDEEIKKVIEQLGYIFINKNVKNDKQFVTIKDDKGYFYNIVLSNIKRVRNPRKFHTSNPYTIQNIKLWCKLEDKPFELLSDKYEGNDKYLRWQCLKEDCKEIFESCWSNIYTGQGCGVCVGRQVTLSNCLATVNPDLAKQWHPTKNGNLTPYDVTVGYEKTEVWWQCKDNPKHEWTATISSRNIGRGCPYCAGYYSSEDNNLLIDNPELCEEWNYRLNSKFPTEYLPHGTQHVWWKCKECGHEWKATILDRNRNDGKASSCPECNKSKGEKECKRIFDLRNVYCIPQKTFDGLLGLGNGLLSYDFYIPKYNLLLEYQGEQHERYIEGFHKSKKDFEKQVEHDRRKKEYALQNNYNFLEIWYYDFDNIESILDKYLSSLKEVMNIA